MSRAWRPSRLAVAAASAALLASTGVSAQVASADRDRRGGSVTTFGSPAAQACADAVMHGDSSDAALRNCDRAFSRERLNREQEVAIHLHRGVMHMRRQDAAEALADFDAAIAVDPAQPEAFSNRGAVLVQLRRYGEAVIALTTALGLDVREPHKAYLNRGSAREHLGDLRGAYEDYATALEIQPNWNPAEAELARFARSRRDHLAEVLGEQPIP